MQNMPILKEVFFSVSLILLLVSVFLAMFQYNTEKTIKSSAFVVFALAVWFYVWGLFIEYISVMP